jgi:hypothetical protein
VSSFITILRRIFNAIFHDFWKTWMALFEYLFTLLLIICGVRKINIQHALSKRFSCVPIKHPSMKLPDPMIYDQYYMMSRGLAVSWQNPDIEIRLDGAPIVSGSELQPSTTYTIHATIHNQSPHGIVVDMPVEFSFLSFGAGTQSHIIPGPAQIVSLGVKGTQEGSATAIMPWTTPAAPGHYCVQVTFEYIDDLNPFNNLGQNNVHVVQAASPAPFVFQLRNCGRIRRLFHFDCDTYVILSPPTCPDATTGATEAVSAGPFGVPAGVRRRNSRASNPLPPGWKIAFNPESPTLESSEEIVVSGTITPPDSFQGTQPVNVHAFFGSELAGGFTIIVRRV